MRRRLVTSSIVLMFAVACVSIACTGEDVGAGSGSSSSSSSSSSGSTTSSGQPVGEGGVVRQRGEKCTAADSCLGGVCVDGYCCESRCTDTCAACDVPGKEGTCAPVTGKPHGDARACLGEKESICAGSCDGVNTTACAFPTSACGSAPGCAAGVATLAGVCKEGTCNGRDAHETCADGLCGASACQHVAQVAVGYDFTCALLTDGTVRCWGHNNVGQLGLGDQNDRPTPTPVPGLTGVTAISAADQHACAIVADGALKCWGTNVSHQLGLGEATTGTNVTPMQLTPAAVCATGTNATCAPLKGVKKVAAGFEQTCAIALDGDYIVKCWGRNTTDGNLGNGTFTTPGTANPANVVLCKTPVVASHVVTCANDQKDVLVNFNGGIVDLATGVYHTCAIDGGGSVYCWGNNGAGEIGLDTSGTASVASSPWAVHVNNVNVTTKHALKVATHGYGVCAIVGDADPTKNLVRCWGYGSDGERGDGTNGGTAYGPAPVTVQKVGGGDFMGATSLGASAYGVCAVANGALFCWGKNDGGQAAQGATGTALLVATPTLLTTGVLDVVSDGTGYTNTVCSTMSGDKALRCWGINNNHQLGDGTTTSPQPTPVAQTW